MTDRCSKCLRERTGVRCGLSGCVFDASAARAKRIADCIATIRPRVAGKFPAEQALAELAVIVLDLNAASAASGSETSARSDETNPETIPAASRESTL